MPLGLFLPGGPAGGTEAIFLPLVKCPTAPRAVLGLYPAEFYAAVAIGASGRASSDIIPVHAHKPLPVWIVAQIIHVFPQDGIESGEVFPDLGPRP